MYPQPTPIVLESGAVDGVDGATKTGTTLRRITEKRRAWAAARAKQNGERRGRVRVGQVGEAGSRGFHTVLTVEGDREAGLKELSAQPLKHVHPCCRLEPDA